MRGTPALIILCISLIIMGGCLMLDDTESDSAPNSDTIATETPDMENSNRITPEDGCKFVDKGIDPVSAMCLVEEKPPDIRVENKYTEKENISVFINNDETVTYSQNITLHALEDQILEDVITAPGNYTIKGVSSDGTIAEDEWAVNERYDKTGEVQWVIQITKERDIRIFRVSTY